MKQEDEDVVKQCKCLHGLYRKQLLGTAKTEIDWRTGMK